MTDTEIPEGTRKRDEAIIQCRNTDRPESEWVAWSDTPQVIPADVGARSDFIERRVQRAIELSGQHHDTWEYRLAVRTVWMTEWEAVPGC